MLLVVHSEFIFNSFTHGAQRGNILSHAVTCTLQFPLNLIIRFRAANQLKKTSSTLQDRSQHPPHRSHGTYRPDLVEDKPHNHDGEQYSDEAIASRGQFRRSSKTFKRDHVKGERNLYPHVVKPWASGDPRCEERDRSDHDNEGRNRIHERKKERGSSQSQDKSADARSQQAESQALFQGSRGGES